MEHYGSVPQTVRDLKVSEFRQFGHAFWGYNTGYSNANEYGVGFLRTEVVVNEVTMHPMLEFIELISGFENSFGQDLAVIRKLPG
jgi:hypothetical protein